MNYITIEEKAWLNLIGLVRQLSEKVDALSERMDPKAEKKWLDTNAAVAILNISKRALQSYRDNGTIGYTFIGRKCYYASNEVRAMLNENLKLKGDV